MKFEKNGHIVEVFEENTFSIFEREGFKVVEEDDKNDLLKQAKELGIKGANLMSAEKLQEKIEATK